MELTFFGHSCFQIKAATATLLIDPFLPNLTIRQKNELNPDYILLTHGHSDHIGDTVSISKHCQAPVIAMNELAVYLSWKGIQTIPLNIGGSYPAEFGRIIMTPACHSSALIAKDKQAIIYLGEPAGFIIEIEGKYIYHAGDTGLFGDMRLLGELYPLDVALLPIGDKYTMDPKLAAYAASLLNAKLTIPMHYNTFPAITQDPHQFIKLLEEQNLIGKTLNPDETLTI